MNATAYGTFTLTRDDDTEIEVYWSTDDPTDVVPCEFDFDAPVELTEAELQEATDLALTDWYMERG